MEVGIKSWKRETHPWELQMLKKITWKERSVLQWCILPKDSPMMEFKTLTLSKPLFTQYKYTKSSQRTWMSLSSPWNASMKRIKTPRGDSLTESAICLRTQTWSTSSKKRLMVRITMKHLITHHIWGPLLHWPSSKWQSLMKWTITPLKESLLPKTFIIWRINWRRLENSSKGTGERTSKLETWGTPILSKIESS